MAESTISHAIILPRSNLSRWLQVIADYETHFERVAVVASPRGNDLNRFRNVTAIQVPGMWFGDDALVHIRRIYPLVIRVDRIQVSSPEELQVILNKRVTNNDRYGEGLIDVRQSISDRFVLEYPAITHTRKIVNPYNQRADTPNQNPGIDFFTRSGNDILAAIGGHVQQISMGSDAQFGMQNYVQVVVDHEDEQYEVTYGEFDTVSVSIGQAVTVGQVLGHAENNTVRLVVRKRIPQTNIFEVINPSYFMYIQDLRVRVIDTGVGLRVRRTPQIVDDNIILTVPDFMTFEADGQTPAQVLERVGNEETSFVRIKLPAHMRPDLGNGRQLQAGWVSGAYLEAITAKEAEEHMPKVNPVGVNLDPAHAQRIGEPRLPSDLGKMGWVRILYNVTLGNPRQFDERFDLALQRYRPVVQKYHDAGYKVMFVVTHQTWGEGHGEFWDAANNRWMAPNDPRWGSVFADSFANRMRQIVQGWVGSLSVDAWQIWNEQDTPVDQARAAIPIAPEQYALLFTKVARVIRSLTPNVFVITGGYVSGPSSKAGAGQARTAISRIAPQDYPDGIAVHPYGRGPYGTITNPHNDGVYQINGHIGQSISAYGNILVDRPIWITEWGSLGTPEQQAQKSPQAVANYALDMIEHVKRTYPNKVAALIWYAWADGMDNGYGLVDRSLRPNNPLYDQFIRA